MFAPPPSDLGFCQTPWMLALDVRCCARWGEEPICRMEKCHLARKLEDHVLVTCEKPFVVDT